LAYRELLEKGINEANKRAESDKALKDVLKQYNGRRVVINVMVAKHRYNHYLW